MFPDAGGPMAGLSLQTHLNRVVLSMMVKKAGLGVAFACNGLDQRLQQQWQQLGNNKPDQQHQSQPLPSE
ncbi:hypothetical protein HaLaN_31838, partial [Haematococcus lacustris]